MFDWQKIVKRIIVHGPAVVLIDKEGTLVPQPQDKALQFPVDYIFVQANGESVGTSNKLADVASTLKKWALVISMPSGRVRKYNGRS